MSKTKPKVLITGVAGFIGSNLAERLIAEGYPVTGIDNLAYGVSEQIPGAVDFNQFDIRSADLPRFFKGIDTVFHLAAKNCIDDCQNDPVETVDLNVTGSVNVFEACRRAGVRKVVYAESSAVYEGSQMFPTPESELAPRSFYAISKACEMHYAKAYERFYGLNMTGLRYFSVYGPKQDYRRTIPPLMSAFILRLLAGERPVIYGNGRKRRDFIYVDDVNDFHMTAMTNDSTTGHTYNLGSGTNYSVQEIYEIVDGFLNTGIKPETKEDLLGEAETTLADITEAKNLGWNPKIDIHTGIRNMIAWLKENVDDKNMGETG